MPDGELKTLEIQWPAGVPKTCSQGMLVTAVRLWCRFASDIQIAKYLNIPAHAVKSYTQSLWWAELVKQLRPQLDFDIEASFGRIGFKALEQLEDRLTYGDFYITRSGERARRPLDAKSLAMIAQIAVDKRRDARHMVEGTTEAATEGRSDLAILADLLRTAAQKQQAIAQKHPATIDVTPVDNKVPEPTPLHPTADSRVFG